MECNGFIRARARSAPPLHCVDMDVGAVDQPPRQFVVAKFLAATVIWVYRVGHESNDRTPVLPHGILPSPDQHLAMKSMDSTGAVRRTTTRTCPLAHEVATVRLIVALPWAGARTAPAAM